MTRTLTGAAWRPLALASALALAPAMGALAHDGHGPGALGTRLSSYQEVPAVSSTAIGKFRARIDEKSGSIAYDLDYAGLQGDVLMAHIHLGQKGVNGGIMVWLCQTAARPDPTGLSPVCPQTGSVSGLLQAANVTAIAAQGLSAQEFNEVVSAIRAGVAYVNVHSTTFPGGELRGQLRDD